MHKMLIDIFTITTTCANSMWRTHRSAMRTHSSTHCRTSSTSHRANRANHNTSTNTSLPLPAIISHRHTPTSPTPTSPPLSPTSSQCSSLSHISDDAHATLFDSSDVEFSDDSSSLIPSPSNPDHLP